MEDVRAEEPLNVETWFCDLNVSSCYTDFVRGIEEGDLSIKDSTMESCSRV